MTIHAAYYGGHEYESIRDAVAAHDAGDDCSGSGAMSAHPTIAYTIDAEAEPTKAGVSE